MKTKQEIIKEVMDGIASFNVTEASKQADELAEEYVSKIEKDCEERFQNIRLRIEDLHLGIRRAYNTKTVLGELRPEDYEQRAATIVNIHKTYVKQMAMAIRLRAALKVLAMAK